MRADNFTVLVKPAQVFENYKLRLYFDLSEHFCCTFLENCWIL